ncbi:CoA pyrophosphatase [Curvivirga aplysinae]|uniref:CoA pyrophosphatase n=1 Tax=Curvivirga aplysinae TaxID=2529852 RepID=UPI0012BC3AF2|nr:CoA pyrophosphatase [Curvivirga aplysinae]MTI10256.1 CoA pyrophosphatase [Curvivirga aplysinae]
MHITDVIAALEAHKIRQSEDTRKRGDADLNPGMQPMRDPLTPASVLVPLVQRNDGITVLLTQRTDHLHDHAGQISFPGGRAEKDDSDAIDTALRETEEEVGLNRRHVETIGQLDPYITRTGFDVTPVVGVVTPPFETELDDFEVASIFEVPLTFFLNRENHVKQAYEFESIRRHFYVLPYKDYHIWGATAGMLVNLVDILEGK